MPIDYEIEHRLVELFGQTICRNDVELYSGYILVGTYVVHIIRYFHLNIDKDSLKIKELCA